MDESTTEERRPSLLPSLVSVTLAILATITLIAAMSGFRAEAAPEPGGSDLALFDGQRGLWHLRYGDGTLGSFYFGVPGDLPLLGDWDCDGVDTVALFRPQNGFVYLRNSNAFGVADQSFFYGVEADVPVAGDWDGDGCDSLGVQRNGEFFLADTLGTVPANTQFFYGLPDDVPFVGDFDGDGRDTIGLHRAGTGRVYLSNTTLDGQIPDPAQTFYFGVGSDRMLAGDWDADGDDSVGLYRASDHRFRLAFENGQPFSDQHIDFGTGDWLPVAGSLGESPSALAATLVGAGDISRCDNQVDEATAALLDAIPGTVFTAGDHAYPDGTADQFADCFHPTWGRHLDRMRPSAGNHDYHTTDAAGYFAYFGTRAGSEVGGWYSYNLGGWHIVALNSNCDAVGGCDVDSAQHDWLVADLAASEAACTLAYWHHPLWNAGRHQGSAEVLPLWEALMAADAEIVLNGHDHNYQRWATQDPTGVADPDGIRQFVVGTGGAAPYSQTGDPSNLEVFGTDHGVLKLSLDPAGYVWEFVPIAGSSFTDRGSELCR